MGTPKSFEVLNPIRLGFSFRRALCPGCRMPCRFEPCWRVPVPYPPPTGYPGISAHVDPTVVALCFDCFPDKADAHAWRRYIYGWRVQWPQE